MHHQPPKESKVEIAKRASRHLRGNIAEVLASEATHFKEADAGLLKFHGIYQQDDRDVRRQRRADGREKAYQFVVRCAIPGGAISAPQYVALDDIAQRCGSGSIRVTTRQDVQLHGILKDNLKQAITGINAAMLTTFAACGDARRNVVACPAPLADEARGVLRRLTREITDRLQPATRAYREIWLGESKMTSTNPVEPFYGDQYLPRKFKIGLALDCDNCIDVFTQDCGLIAIVDRGSVRGFNVLVGGGMGRTHGKAETFAGLAQPLGFVEPDHAVEAVSAIAAIFRDHGNRGDRRRARLKYLIADWGLDRFREEFGRRVPFESAPPADLPSPPFHDHLGPHPQGDGRWFYGVFIENGRITDRTDRHVMTALRSIVARHKPGVVFTPQQNVLLTDLAEPVMDRIERVLRDHGLTPPTELPAVERHAMACPALPTCGLAVAESERQLPAVVDRFKAELAGLGLRDAPIAIRMTGCPNGCARTYTADIAFVGRRAGVYDVFVGGGLRGDRIVDLYAADVAADELALALRPLLAAWAKGRRDNEGLGDYYHRLTGRTRHRSSITGAEEPTSGTIRIEGAAEELECGRLLHPRSAVGKTPAQGAP